MLVGIAAIFGFRIWSQDVSQAYLQSADKLMREVYVKPSREFRLSHDKLLRLLKPLYGLSDSGDYWHVTFTRHLTEELGMTHTTGDLSLFFKVIHDELSGITGAYVDDTIGAGTPAFENTSRLTEQRFQSKEREFDSITFAGIEIDRKEYGFIMHQTRFARKVKQLHLDCTYKQYRSKRQELAWLVHTRPDIAADVNLAAQVIETQWGRKDVLEINKLIRHVHSTATRGIRQHKLDRNTLSLRAYTDSSFSNTPDLKSQLGFLIVLADSSGRANLLHFASHKSRRVTRSVMGAEVLAFADGFDFAFLLRHDLRGIMKQKLPLAMFTDSDSLFKTIVKSTTTTEKRLMIDVEAAREAYGRQDISDVGWIRSQDNPADGLTKRGRCEPLERFLDTGYLNVPVQQWIIRSPLTECVSSRDHAKWDNVPRLPSSENPECRAVLS